MGRMSTSRVCSALLALMMLAGCGSERLWSRYRAEAELWRAQRMTMRLGIEPRLAGASDFDRAIGAHTSVVAHYPPGRWVPLAIAGDALARDIAEVSGDAALAIARLEEARGDTPRAVAAYRRVASDYRGIWPTAWRGMLGVALTLERAGDSALALPQWERLAREVPMVAPDGVTVVDASFDAALRVADAAARRGQRAVVESLISASDARLDTLLARHHGDLIAPGLWIHRGELHSMGSGPSAAHAARGAFERALLEPEIGDRAADVVLAIAEAALDESLIDTAVAYARRAQVDFGHRVALEGVTLEARAWNSIGKPDSAEQAYDRFIDRGHVEASAMTEARFRQAELLERLDRWEMARGSYHAVVASDPLSPLAFESMKRVVQHHRGGDEMELAAIEGRWAIEKLDRTLATVHDPDVLAMARTTRAQLFEMIGDERAAAQAYADLWRGSTDRAEGVAGAFAAAQLASGKLHDAARAETLYDEVSRMAARPEDRLEARRLAAGLRR